MAGRRRLDVHRIYIELVRHIAGSICGRDPTRHVSEHHVNASRQIADCRPVGVVVCHLFSTAGWLERAKGNY